MTRPLPVHTKGVRETPVCPTHGHPLTVLEEGDLNGTTVRWWGGCPGDVVVCQFHAERPLRATSRRCVCRGGCGHEVRTADTAEEPTLPMGDT